MVFAAMYRWEVNPGEEDEWVREWREDTKRVYKEYGSLGSSLHKDWDGTYVAYARWPTKELWESMREILSKNPDKHATMIGEPVCLDLIDDFLQYEVYRKE
jgi:heme-degrading monooxygenase HmoA